MSCHRSLLRNVVSLGLLALLSTACVSTPRPMEAARLAQLDTMDVHSPSEDEKNPWIAGGLGILAPACNLYLYWGTNRAEQLPMAVVNLATWPISVAWAVPACALDTANVNRLSRLDRSLQQTRR